MNHRRIPGRPSPITRRLIWLALALIGIVLTYLFSSQTTTVSNSISKQLVRMVMEAFPSLRRLPEEQLTALVETWNLVLRKAAHFTIYLLVAACLTVFLQPFPGPALVKGGLVVVLGFLCATLDEWHQTFVPGRTGSFRDVLLDTGGVLVGAIGTICFIQFRNRRHGRNH